MLKNLNTMKNKYTKFLFKTLFFSIPLLCFSYRAQAENNFIVAPSGGNITGKDLSTKLANENVIIMSSQGSPGQGNVIINDSISWSSNNTLTIIASNNIVINNLISASGDSAKLVILPKKQNGTESPNLNGAFILNGANISLSGSQAAFSLSEENYIVVNRLGSQSDINNPSSSNSLQAIAASQNLSKNFVLGTDIDASQTSTWNNQSGFTPIGTSQNPFTATFLGLGHTISNLSVNRVNSDNIGLFGATSSNAKIKNLGIKKFLITGQNSVGALVGYNNGNVDSTFAEEINITGDGTINTGTGGLIGNNAGNISNSFSTGTITGTNNLGGLAGVNAGQINSGYSTVSITNAAGSDGGLVGRNQSKGVITGSFFSGIVTDTGEGGQLGGLVGINKGKINYSNALGQINCSNGSSCGGLVASNGSDSVNGSINNTYATNRVNGDGSSVGGLVGENLSGSSISNSYATSLLLGQLDENNTGGLVGNNSGQISNSYWNSSLSNKGVGSGESTGLTGLNSQEMRVSSNFNNFNLTSIPGENAWVVINNDGSFQTELNNNTAATSPLLASEHLTKILNEHQLQLILMDLGAAYSQIDNIDLSRTRLGDDVWGENGFIPIGSINAPFHGTLNGGEKIINNLYITSNISNVGLFGYTNNAAISDLALTNARIIGNGNTAVLVGNMNGGSVNNSAIDGHVKGTTTFQNGAGANMGVLAGFSTGTVLNSASSGLVYGGQNVGGLIGYNAGNINTSSSSANVNARAGVTSGIVGGLIGFNNGNIFNSYATGDVISKKGLGGLVGTNDLKCFSHMFYHYCQDGKIQNSYAKNQLAKSGTTQKYVGGLVGQGISHCSWFQCYTAQIQNSYWDSTTSNLTSSAGGNALNDQDMKKQQSFQTWDFNKTWKMDIYPKLQSAPSF